MKMSVKKISFVLVLLLILFQTGLFAGGSQEKDTIESSVNNELQAETVVIAYNEYFTKSFGPADPPIDVIKAAVAEKYPNITVELQTTPLAAGAMHDAYVTWFMSQDDKIDILGVGAYWTAEFGEAGWLIPLENKVNSNLLKELNPSYLDAHSYQGSIYGLGPWWGGIGGLYYRKDLLEEYGFAPPETYDDVVEICTTILADMPEMTGWTWPAMVDTVLVNRWTEFLYGFGGEFFNSDGSSAVDSEAAVNALTYMNNLIKNGISPQEITSWKEEDSQVRFLNGESIFHSGRQDMMFWLDDPEQSKIAKKWGFIQNPAQPGGKHSGFYEGWAFGINKYTDVPDAAMKVLEIMFSFPVQKLFNLSQGPLQANMGVYTDAEVLANNPNMKIIEGITGSATPPIPSPNYVEISDVLKTAIHSVLTGQIEPRAGLEKAAKEINTIVE